MKDNEFYRSNEIKQINEFKQFKAENYHKKEEVNINVKEIANTGDEYTYTTKNEKPQKENSNIVEKVVKKVTTSVSTVATTVASTAAVVVASVVMFVAIITGNPKIDVAILEVSENKIEYDITMDELDSELKYYLSIESIDYFYEQMLFAGQNKGIIENLKPDTNYNLKVIGKDLANEISVYYEETIKTISSKLPIIPTAFDGSYQFPTKESISVDWLSEENYIIRIPMKFETNNEDIYKYRIKLHTNEGEVLVSYTGTNPLFETDLIKDTEYFSMTTEILIIVDGIEYLYDSNTINNIELSRPMINLDSNINFIETNTFEFSYSIDSNICDYEVYDYLEFNITFDDQTSTTLTISDIIPNTNMKVLIENVPSNTKKIDIDANLYYKLAYSNQKDTSINGKSYQLTNYMKLDEIIVDNKIYYEIKLKFNYHLFDNEMGVVKDLDTNQEYYLDGNYAYITLDENRVYNLNYYIVDDNQNIISEISEISIPVEKVEGEYSFIGVNPGDILKTYNEDGTINLYIDTQFETEDPDISYVIYMNDSNDKQYEAEFRSYVASFESLPENNYYLRYYVYKQVDDVKYVLGYTHPSGGVEDISDFVVSCTLDDANVLRIILYNNIIYDLNNFKLILDGETEIVITESNIKTDLTTDNIVVETTLPTSFDELELKISCGINHPNYDAISEEITVIGSLYKERRISLNPRIITNLPDTFDGTYQMPSIDDITIDWTDQSNYLISIPFKMTSNDPNIFKYRITLLDENNVVLLEDESTDAIYQAALSKNYNSFIMKLEVFGRNEDFEKVYDTFTSSKIDLALPNIEVASNVELLETGKFSISYLINTTLENYETYEYVEFNVRYLDNTTETIKVDNLIVNQLGYFTIENVPSGIDSMVIDTKVVMKPRYSINTIEITNSSSYNFTNTYTITDQIVDNINSNEIVLRFKHHILNNNTLVIKDTSNNTLYYLTENECRIPIDATTYNLSYYVIDSDNNTITEESTLQIDTTRQTGEYTMNYINPSEYVITYNDDETINLYANVNFETTDENVLYEVVLENYETGIIYYQSRENVVAVENIKKVYYSLQYNVYKEVNGIKYLLYNVYPSGSIDDESNNYINASLTNGQNLTIEFYDTLKFDDTSFKLITSSNKEIIITSDQIVYNATNSTYQINITLDEVESFVTLILEGSTMLTDYDAISAKINIKGNKYRTITLEISSN